MKFCKNCGNQMDDLAAVCVKCGVAAGEGSAFCGNCGAPVTPGAAFCTKCGAACAPQYAQNDQKSKVVAGILGILLGSLGVHNFYLGYTTKAIIQLVLSVATCGIGAAVSGIWGLIEGIMILCGNVTTDAKGVPLKD